MTDARGGPSRWIARWAHLVPAETLVLDVAAGAGRHAAFFADSGHRVVAVDRDITRLPDRSEIETLKTDLEDGSPWPLGGRTFGAVIVTNYLHRPLLPALLESIERGGILLYETFMIGNERFGKPSNPDFLLQDGELLELVRGKLSVVAYEAGPIGDPPAAMVQRIAARRL